MHFELCRTKQFDSPENPDADTTWYKLISEDAVIESAVFDNSGKFAASM